MGPVAAVHELVQHPRAHGDVAASMARIRSILEAVALDYLAAEIPRAISESLDGVERTAHIVRAMKEFSHPADEKTAVDLNRAIESTLTVSRNEWKYVAELVTDFDPALPPVPCLPGEFNQVMLNLIVNAAHAIGEVLGERPTAKGKITIRTRCAGAWAEIEVADTGAGIPAPIRHRIFDPFFTTKGVGKGTGQGLSIAHTVVVRKHGGTIDVESEAGKGTSFLLRLPMAPRSETARTAEEEAIHA
jgi:signal transduction histidine kinase